MTNRKKSWLAPTRIVIADWPVIVQIPSKRPNGLSKEVCLFKYFNMPRSFAFSSLDLHFWKRPSSKKTNTKLRPPDKKLDDLQSMPLSHSLHEFKYSASSETHLQTYTDTTVMNSVSSFDQSELLPRSNFTEKASCHNILLEQPRTNITRFKDKRRGKSVTEIRGKETRNKKYYSGIVFMSIRH
uniref:Ovule protein n=1 Tax=Heterorhabditis bacteriophora TaxID=37862 RepID=A0A1I7XGI5_HETBA